MTTLRLRMTPAPLCLCLALACTALGFAILHQALPGLALAMGDWLPTFATSQTDRMALAVVQYSLLPRITMSILVGAALGLAGVLMQQVLRNPIASPTTLGVASGAQLGLLVATLYAPGLLVFGGEWVALAGGGLSLMLVLSLSWRQRLAPVAVVLSGLVVNLYLGALSTVLILFNQEEFRGLMIWAAGSMAQNSWDDTLHLLPRLLVAIALAALLARPLKLLELNESNARSLGASVRQLRLTGLGLSVFITASAVSLVGIVGFVGLAAPAIVRLMGARTLGQRLIWAPVFGGLLLLTTDLLLLNYSGRLPSLVPTGAMTGLLGAPLLLWMIPRLALEGSPEGASATMLQAARTRAVRRLPQLMVVLTAAAALALFVSQSPQGWTLDGIDHWSAIAQWRLPRILAAAGAGILLALAGTTIQRITGNPMASPEVLGISAGTAIGLIVTIYLVASVSLPLLIVAGSVSAFVTLAILILLNRRSGFQADRLLLTGIAIAALFDPLRSIFLANGDPRIQQMIAWMSGSTYYVDMTMGLSAIVFAVIMMALTPLVARWLDLLPLGRATALGLGVRVNRVRLALLAMVAVLTAFATLIVGPLSFAGLLAPHMARMLGLSRALPHLLGAAMIGAILMVSADWLGRQMLFPQEVPAGLVSALLGGAYFMWGLRRH
ncbi:Fe(3+)-hydroxamate ABC transporter permease FhuB [Marinobacter zhanjiangensis]|uniref:Fe3+-hydroxamate ABC transporter permease FhuB n=1 Tax=Marinobacter zhanjiangensis TaxID=578215 RepID=A0ABQ3B0K8_9GAMM|nr:Fe(3+)-hydroxamate ABC transporter permease FhuB [Marinobacter zhanjiangensis]GGY69838.1 Fe3+-hydroxamate ABC transporter permease FhuB [Marinobacter zhanjiangensis]